MFNNRLVKRKWGWYLTLLDRKHFKVKLLRFFNGGKLSKQFHRDRNELWLFLSGSGDLLHDKNMIRCYPGFYELVEELDIHQFSANKTTYILEIQYGERCDEGDIVRV